MHPRLISPVIMLLASRGFAFVPAPPRLQAIQAHILARTGRYSRIPPGSNESLSDLKMSATVEIQSPFAGPRIDDDSDEEDIAPLRLTLENVEKVLDEMRPYLISDGGNVRVVEIDGPIVRLELQGACGSCPSSTMTMKMGLERKLIEKIPEISEVVQSVPGGPQLTIDEIEKVLDTVRPFLSVAGGSICVAVLEGVGGLQPHIGLKMSGKSNSLQSVKMEIIQRLQRHFMDSGLRIDYVKD